MLKYFVFFLICIRLFIYSAIPDGISYYSFEENKAKVHVIEVDPEKFDIVSARPSDVIWDDVLAISKRHPEAVAGINAGFYVPTGEFTGLPLGTLKINNRWYCTSQQPRAAIGWSNDNPNVIIDVVNCLTTLKSNSISYPVDGVNLLRNNDEVIIYNDNFLRTTKTVEGCMEYVVNIHNVASIGYNNSPIPKGGFVLSVPASKMSRYAISVGSSLKYQVQVQPKLPDPATTSRDWDNVSYIVGGMGLLIKNGKKVIDHSLENITDDIFQKKHPRTAIGLLDNGNWVLVVVDGRRNVPGRPLHKSVGISMSNLTDVMLKLGCVQALNLDGGGSTTMVLMHEVINEPCGYDLLDRSVKLRKVSDAILILPKNRNVEVLNVRSPPAVPRAA